MSSRMGILVSSFDFSPVAEDEFHDWYDTEHIPERSRIPGFLCCRRWLSVEDAKVSMTTYDLASIDVLRSAGYLAIGYENNSPWTRRVGWRCIKRLRFEGEQIWPGDGMPPQSADGLLVWASNVDPAHADASSRWYDGTFLPELARLPGVLCARRFRATSSTHGQIVIFYLADVGVVRQAAWRQATTTAPVSHMLTQEQDRLSTLCRAYRRAADT